MTLRKYRLFAVISYVRKTCTGGEKRLEEYGDFGCLDFGVANF